MSTYKLHYFNFRGRGEIIRLIFAAAGEKFDDVRYERQQWPALKPTMPLGQVPVLEYDGTQLPQSLAIARFVAKQFNLAGKDNFEQAKVDAVVDTVNDAFNTIITTVFNQEESKKEEARKKFFQEELPKYVKNLDTLAKLYSNGGPYFIGNQLTWADLYFYSVFQNFVETDPDCLNSSPWLKQNRTEVEKQPRIAEYLASRPKTAY